MILVYGATGFAGRLISRNLLERGEAILLGGRDRWRLEAVKRELGTEAEIRVAPAHDRDALVAMLEGASCIINCTGPYLLIGEPIVAAALEAGVPYVDISAEQAFLRHVYERYESAARRARCPVVSGCGFEAALGDWAGNQACHRTAAAEDRTDELVIAYALDQFRPTAGTQRSVLAQLAEPANEWHEDRWEAVPAAGESREFDFPPPFGHRDAVSFPAGEIVTAPRHLRSRRIQAYVALLGEAPGSRLLSRFASAFAPALPALMQSPLGAFARARVGHASTDPSPTERNRTRFSIVADARSGATHSRIAVVGGDPYDLTAEIASRAALALTAGKLGGGVFAPAQLLEPRSTLEELAETGWIEVLES